MIDLSTIAGLHERDHELHAYCGHCERWIVLDLGHLIATGYGSRRVPFHVRCQVCGERGQAQLCPPTPTRSSTGWITPPTHHDMIR